MNIPAQFRISLGLVALLVSTVFVADFLGLLPRPEELTRESRKLVGESLAVQLSSAVARGRKDVVEDTISEIVRRNQDVVSAGLWRANGREIATFGGDLESAENFDYSSLDSLVVPIFEGNVRWGEVRLNFMPTQDWGHTYLGVPSQTLRFILFLAAACALSFFLFMRRALQELNPTKVVPQRVNAAFDVLAEGVLIVDEKERIVLANSSFSKRLGLDPEAMIGKNPNIYQWDLKGDGVEMLPWQAALVEGEHVVGMPLTLDVDDSEIKFTVNAAPIEDGRGDRKGVLVTFDDVTPLEAKNAELAEMLSQLGTTHSLIAKKNKELEVLATRDPLTGCLNRRSFLQSYLEQFKQAQAGECNLTVMMVDIDHFKKVNDTYGHGVGDQAIQLVADTLSGFFRKEDAVGRYGGEEFVVSVPGIGLERGSVIADRAREKIKELVESDQLPMESMSVSIGIAQFDASVSDEAELLDRADKGLYKAKESGRDRVCAYDPNYESVSEEQQNRSLVESEGGESIAALRGQLTQLKELVEVQANEITHRSMHDDLTGLPNRYLLLDRLEQAMNLSSRNNSLTAVVSVSLSGHQHLEESEGVEVSQKMLKQASLRIEKVLRAVDSIGVAFNEQALTFSRISYNELAVLVVDLASVESIPKIISRVTSALEEPFIPAGNEVFNKVYCGTAVFPNDGSDPDALVRNASLARSFAERRSERSSGNAFFSKDIDELSIMNAKIAKELNKAINEDSLEVAYQPKVDSRTQRVTGVEALARWNHPDLGRVGPLEFITVAEQIGLIDRLTDWVMTRVCRDISNGDIGDLRVSVNVSPVELCDPTTSERLLSIVRNQGISPGQIEIEITESSVLNNFDLTRQILKALQDAGMLVALDDFGTAYSSLNLLLEIPVDVIKVDRSFVANIQNEKGNQAVVHAIVQMAYAMGKRIVAEGVETEAELECLNRLGCREIQGYFYSKPLPFAELREFVSKSGIADTSDLKESAATIVKKASVG